MDFARFWDWFDRLSCYYLCNIADNQPLMQYAFSLLFIVGRYKLFYDEQPRPKYGGGTG